MYFQRRIEKSEDTESNEQASILLEEGISTTHTNAYSNTDTETASTSSTCLSTHDSSSDEHAIPSSVSLEDCSVFEHSLLVI